LTTFAPLFYCRGSTNLKLKKSLDAIQDFNHSISLDSTYEPNYFKKGLALFELEEYESAKDAFENSKQMRVQSEKDISLNSRWIRKCEVEIAGLTSHFLSKSQLDIFRRTKCIESQSKESSCSTCVCNHSCAHYCSPCITTQASSPANCRS
jgi:tetratricopeptide (TPR) repeat protein